MKTPLTAVAVSCNLKAPPAASSSDLLATKFLNARAGHGVTGDLVRAVDFSLSPGVGKDMGGGDERPRIRQVLDADSSSSSRRVMSPGVVWFPGF